jgi:glucokinase
LLRLFGQNCILRIILISSLSIKNQANEKGFFVMANGEKRYSIGFDLGGTKMLATLYDDKLKPLLQERKKTKPQDGPDAVIGRIIATIETVLASGNITSADLAGIGIGCPGMVDYDKGVVVTAPNLGWKNLALKDTLKKKFGCSVELLNDADAGIYGEYRKGAAKNTRCSVGVFLGTGVGGGCVYNGEILHSAMGSCFELGHMRLVPRGPLCGCGQQGCLEAVASRLSIASAAAIAAYRGEAPWLLAAAGTDVANIRSGVIAESIKGGDAAVEKIVRTAARWVGVGVANIVNMLGPEVVVLGGGLVEAMPELFLQEIETSAKKKMLPAYKAVKIVLSQLMDDAAVIGAATWAVDKGNNTKG